jgi:hypothetical protein
MGDQVQISRVGERFSSHTLSRSRGVNRPSKATRALREKLVAAMVEVVAEGGDPRLDQARALS